RLAVGVGQFKERRVEPSTDRAAAEIRRAKAHALFFGKRDHINGPCERTAAERLHRGYSEQYAEHAVILTAIRHRIHMGADDEDALASSRPSVNQIADRIDADGQPRFAHPL